jgi:hypothetical protein
MAWYTILFIAVFAVFFVKLIISLFFGDFDLDVDLDGDSDVDSSGAFSFKGILHFLMGFSSYLVARVNLYPVNLNINNGFASFGFFDYFLAVICGIILMFILYFCYKLAVKANCTPSLPQDNINGCTGNIYLNLGNGQYSVEAHTLAGTTNVDAYYSSDDLEIGTEVKLTVENDKILISL